MDSQQATKKQRLVRLVSAIDPARVIVLMQAVINGADENMLTLIETKATEMQ